MLHRNSPKMAVILIYTVLEWILIALLLLNGLFSFLNAKFAAFFGLKPPCVFCSRVDHVFGRRKSYRDLLCDAHAAEVSTLGYCSNHRNLAEASDMCEDCASSRPSETTDRTVAVLSWMKRSEEGEKDLRCSCCDVILESGFYSPYLVLKPSSWGVLDYTQKGYLAEEEEGSEGLHVDVDDVKEDGQVVSPDCGGNSVYDEGEGEKEVEEQREGEGDGEQEPQEQEENILVVPYSDACVKVVEDASLELITQMRMENNISSEEERWVPVELIDSTTLRKSHLNSYLPPGGGHYRILVKKVDRALDIGTISDEEEKAELLSTMEFNSSPTLQVVNFVEEEYSSFHHQCVVPQPTMTNSEEGIDVQVDALIDAEDFGEQQASEEDSKVIDVETNCEISIGSEICDQEQIDLAHFHEPTIPESAGIEDKCPESYSGTTDKEQVIEGGPVDETTARGANRLSVCPEFNEVEEERVPETPTSIEGFHALHKRFLFERREFGTESLDGSVASEIDGSETLTVDHLKSALRSERKALSALYAELEEERSASAIAANQTMAMITRLQEEKAAMQMEALQYQRMMEEQSEYDQEALQLLNELMMKREKEKQDLEKELEVYRKKVLVYEAKERRKVAARSKAHGRSGTSSASSSADSDDLSFESHEGEECKYSHNESNQHTPTDDVLSSVADQETAKHLITVDESLADFEEERLSILEQLKTLEEKLFSLDDDDIKSMGHHFSYENGHGFNGDYESFSIDVNGGVLNGFIDDSDTNGKLHHEPRSVASRGKRLLPLFDATVSLENEDGMNPEQEATDDSPESVSKLMLNDQKKLTIAEEVDNVYERLQALEADREFLKHCISSLKKGDKGMDLLQEILQHLRDLRSVELHVRNAGDALTSLSA